MSITIHTIETNYKQYCKDKKEIEEVPLSYCNWLQLEVLAWMENCKVCKTNTKHQPNTVDKEWNGDYNGYPR